MFGGDVFLGILMDSSKVVSVTVDVFWYREGNLHMVDGKLHRAGGRKIVSEHLVKYRKSPDGTEYWYREGNLHRLDGPAVEKSDGSKIWYLNGLRCPSGVFLFVDEEILND